MEKYKLILTSLILSLFISLFINSNSKAQQDVYNERDSIIVAAKEIINSSQICALITLDKNGLPHIRTMDTFPPEKGFVVWFGTNKFSRKVKEIKNNPNVTIYYTVPTNNDYVVISGKAEIIDDKKEKEKRWKKEWEKYYPNKKEKYILIKVTHLELDVLTSKHNLTPDKKTWRIPNIKF